LTRPLHPENYEQIKKAFGNTPFVRNSEVMSILFEELQVDIIPMEEKNFDTAHMYYSYNDLGNLMGKIYHKFGLKYGHRGLTMPMKDGDNMYAEIVISKDGQEIFDFLGLSYAKFCQGFNDLPEIFDFVISSKYFSKEPFQYENLNHTNRVRDRKRSTYHSFLQYIEKIDRVYPYEENKEKYIPLILESFPSAKREYLESKARLAHRLAVKEKFNGKLISEWTGYEGNKLGEFIQYLKKERGDPMKWVIDFSTEDLKAIIFGHFRVFNLQREK
jgi:hypothetical protein